MGRIGPTEIIIIAVLIIIIFGWKRLPDAARSLGRSARVFKSEVDEMKKENEASKSEASTTTVRSEPIEPARARRHDPADQRRQPRARERPPHGQPARARGLSLPAPLPSPDPMARLRRRPRDPEGRMTLGEHLREFRRRLFIAAASVLVASIVAGLFYDQVFNFLSEPFNEYKRDNLQSTISLNFGEATSALSNLISLSIFVGVVVSSPIWLYQIWAFVVPGLTRKEKRVSLAFLGATIPLFLIGCALAYAILPKSLAILYGFSPEGTSNIQQVSMYFSFVTRFILVFGIGFLFPVVLVGLNAVGAMPANRLLGGWRVAVRADLRLRGRGHAHRRPVHDVRLRGPAHRLVLRGLVRLSPHGQAQGEGAARLARRRRHRGLAALTGPVDGLSRDRPAPARRRSWRSSPPGRPARRPRRSGCRSSSGR